MLPLKGFEGISSKDALRDYNDRDAEHYRFFGWWAFVYDMLRECGSGLSVAWRKRKVKKLRDATLPQFPNSLVCPYCRHIFRKP
jgi:hypothetical protein